MEVKGFIKDLLLSMEHEFFAVVVQYTSMKDIA